MTNQELLNQILAVTARAAQAGRTEAHMIWALEAAKYVLLMQTVKIEPRSPILAYNGPVPPTHG
jgi:hypothetical protein